MLWRIGEWSMFGLPNRCADTHTPVKSDASAGAWFWMGVSTLPNNSCAIRARVRVLSAKYGRDDIQPNGERQGCSVNFQSSVH